MVQEKGSGQLCWMFTRGLLTVPELTMQNKEKTITGEKSLRSQEQMESRAQTEGLL